MLNFKNYRGIVEDNNPISSTIDAQIDQVIDNWVSEILATILNPNNATEPRGLWDRFKGSVANLWHGRNSQNNPYYWQNRFGDDLGKKESFSPNIFTLEEYHLLKEICSNLENQLNESVPGTENLKIVQLIKNSAQQLKTQLKQIFNNPNNSTQTDTFSGNNSDISSQSDTGINPGSFNYDTDSTKQDDQNNKNPQQNGSNSQQDSGLNPEKRDDPYANPPTINKDWASLNDEEVEQWNQYGGGKSLGNSGLARSCFKFVKGKPIVNLPWILRLGDPRVPILLSQKDDTFANKYLDKDKLQASGYPRPCTNKNSVIYTTLLKQGRIETEFNKIKNKEDLDDRIKAISFKNVKFDEPEESKPVTNTENPETPKPLEQKPKRNFRSKPSIAPMVNPEDSNASEKAPNRFNSHPAPMVDPDVKKDAEPHPTDNTALNPPDSHSKQEEKPELNLDDKKKELLQLIASDFPAKKQEKYTDKIMDATDENIEELKNLIQTVKDNYTGNSKVEWIATRNINKNLLESLNIKDKIKYLKECLRAK